MRTSEFLWQEGHTAHATEDEAIAFAKKALEWYRKIYEEYYAMPVIVGIKSSAEKFAGAKTTYTVEALMPDGKALQGATSHNLGQNFSKAFNIEFQNKEGKNDFVWQTSWGFSTRSLGGLFLMHGDDQGLVIPPSIAPIKAVILPILSRESEKVIAYCKEIKEKLGAGVKLWDEEWKTMGWKANEAELKGIPVRIVVGLQEIATNTVTVKTRIPIENQENTFSVPLEILKTELEAILSKVQNALLANARKFLEDNTHLVENYEAFRTIMSDYRGFIKAFWCENPDCEAKIKEETKASTRCLPFEAKDEQGLCIYCGKPAIHRWVFAQAY